MHGHAKDPYQGRLPTRIIPWNPPRSRRLASLLAARSSKTSRLLFSISRHVEVDRTMEPGERMTSGEFTVVNLYLGSYAVLRWQARCICIIHVPMQRLSAVLLRLTCPGIRTLPARRLYRAPSTRPSSSFFPSINTRLGVLKPRLVSRNMDL